MALDRPTVNSLRYYMRVVGRDRLHAVAAVDLSDARSVFDTPLGVSPPLRTPPQVVTSAGDGFVVAFDGRLLRCDERGDLQAMRPAIRRAQAVASGEGVVAAATSAGIQVVQMMAE